MLSTLSTTLAWAAYVPSTIPSDENRPFHERYTLMEEIGKGSYSTVFLSKGAQGESVVVKRYEINNEALIALLGGMGISVEDYVKRLAEKELLMGSLTDHPHIVKIREMHLEGALSYVVMDYVEGNPFDCFEEYPLGARVVFLQQFFSAVEHLLLRNIIVDDLWSENILISHGTHLTLIDLGGYEAIGDGADMHVGHYVNMIEHMAISIGREAAGVLDACKHLLPNAVRNEKITSDHVRKLVYWIEALQKKLSPERHRTNVSGTFHESSPGKVLAAYDQLQTQYPDHISFSTAQHSKFLAYSLIAAQALKKFNPGKYSDACLQNIHFLRYPFSGLPKSLEELFRLLPVREDYDTASSMVGDALISVSPSLKESESDESAWAIFENNERPGDVQSCVDKIFESQHVSPLHFRKRIKQVLKEAPKSKNGLIYNFFIPKSAPIHKAVYLSQPYGIPIGDPLSQGNVLDFYTQYGQGLTKEKNPQLRFLPSALIPENNFDLEKIKSYRFTTIPAEELMDYTHKIEKVVNAIFEGHLEEMLQLAALTYEVEKRSDPTERQGGYQKLCYLHLCRHDTQLAQYYWHKLDNQNPHKPSLLPGIIACLLTNNQPAQAYHYFQEHEEGLMEKEQIVARLALTYLEYDNLLMLDSMLSKLPPSPTKDFVLMLAGNKYEGYAPEYTYGEMTGLLSDDDLIDLGKILGQ